MKKIKKISELREFVAKNGKDFSNMDLSGLDLSGIEPDFWKDAIFYYTNLSHTGIKFIPTNLSFHSIEGCNFEGVDLSNLSKDEWLFIDIKNANLRKTGIQLELKYRLDRCIGAVLLDERYKDISPEDLTFCNIDFSTLEANPFLKVTSSKVLEMIRIEIRDISVFLTEDRANEILCKCEKRLEKYDDGSIKKFYNLLCKDWSVLDRVNFFNRNIFNKEFEKLDLSGISADIISQFNFEKCKFGEIILDNPISELAYIRIFDDRSENEFGKITLKKLSLNTWKELNNTNRIGRITFKRYIYLEIGKKCNARCKFCRNKSFNEGKERNLHAIIANLKKMEEYIDTIFIGGGEPLLYIDDILKIFHHIKTDIVIVTNGSIPIIKKLYNHRIGIYISRHAISDEDNKKILNVVLDKNTKIFSIEEIKELAKKCKVSLTPVCIKGGLDTAEKIEKYIEEFLQSDIVSIIISNLHKDASLGSKDIDYSDLCVDPSIFDQVQQELLKQGFKEKEIICSTGGYILKRFQKSYYSVSFKIYISKDELSKYWESSIKRTFDFTMTPSGDIYQDWNRGLLVSMDEL